jgi:hypothetical protein
MRKMMLSPERLSTLLEPQGFVLRMTDSRTKTIAFIRPSSFSRLFEHLNVQGQGKTGEAVYATTAISGSTGHSHDTCISEEDKGLLYTLETDTDRHWTVVGNTDEAVEWERNLARHADSHCRATAEVKGPALYELLRPTFAAIDRYIEKLGSVGAIFDTEFQYLAKLSDNERKEVERLAFGVGSIDDSSDDVQLACLALVKFSTAIEVQTDPFHGKKVHEDSNLRARIYLLTDFFREQRKLYLAKQ